MTETLRIGQGVYHLMQSLDPDDLDKGTAYCRMYADRTHRDSNHHAVKDNVCKDCQRVYDREVEI